MDSDDLYGPPLPPGFSSCNEDEKIELDKSSKIIGPAIPTHFLSKAHIEDNDTTSSDENQDKHFSNVIGPVMPPGFLKAKSNDSNSDDDLSSDTGGKEEYSTKNSSEIIGPVIPPGLLPAKHEDSEEEDNVPYGPLPTTEKPDEVEDVIVTLEKRAKNMKEKLEHNVPVVPKVEREEWMTTPNTDSRNQLGVISRCLSGGTSKSKSSKRKHDDKGYSKSSVVDEKLSKELKKFNESKRSKSLLDMHRKNKKKEKDSSKPPERKPFDRDEELAVRHFTKEQVDSVIKKSKFLNSRFSAGTSKYL